MGEIVLVHLKLPSKSINSSTSFLAADVLLLLDFSELRAAAATSLVDAAVAAAVMIVIPTALLSVIFLVINFSKTFSQSPSLLPLSSFLKNNRRPHRTNL